MKILSFDVGIKNLAYCLFSINCCNDNLLKIIKWDVINLCESTSSSSSLNKNKTKYTCSMCKKNAYYYLNLNTTTTTTTTTSESDATVVPKSVMYCKKHAIETKIVVDDGKKNKPKQKKKEPYLSLINPSKPKQQNACDVDMIILGINLKTKFDFIFNEYASSENELSIDAVVIENQIGPLAGRMKMLQGMIAQYFIMKNVNKIEFISATNKLKLFKNVKNNENETNENSYKLRKQQGQIVCRSLISFYPCLQLWNQEFDKHLKKDDLADCFLQGYYYMYSNHEYKSMFAFELDLFLSKML
jgi:hypothetical protein